MDRYESKFWISTKGLRKVLDGIIFEVMNILYICEI